MIRHRFTHLVLVFSVAGAAHANDKILSNERYLEPPREVMEAVLAPWHQNVSVGNLSPDRQRFIIQEREGLPPLALFARPHHKLAGVQVDPAANRHRRFTTRSAGGFRVYDLTTKRETSIEVPRRAGVSDPSWSPDGSRIAFFAHYDNGSYIYLADARTGKTRRLTARPVLATLSTSYDWADDGKKIVAVFIPDSRPKAPVAHEVPETPLVRVSDSRAKRLRTHQSLLTTPHDQELLEYYGTGQLAVVDAGNGRMTAVGKPAMITSFSSAPDGQFFRVTFMEKPFSYLVPMSNFPSREQIWDMKGDSRAQLARRALRLGFVGDPSDSERAFEEGNGWWELAPADEEVVEQRGGQQSGAQQPAAGRRALSWRPDGAGLSYLQLEPQQRRQEGEPEQKRKDRVMLWRAPFGEKDHEVVYETEDAIQSVRYSEDCRTLFLSHSAGDRSRVVAVNLDKPGEVKNVFESRGADFYNNPGDLMMKPGPKAGSVVRMSSDGKHVYLSGTRYHKDPLVDAPQPFIDRVEIGTDKKDRIFESNALVFETASLLDDDATTLLVTRQSKDMIPNTYLVERSPRRETKITNNQDYLPDITQARRELVTVTRPDGVSFRVRVTLPQNWSEGQKPPAMFWFYPREYVDQAAYDRTLRTFNKNSFQTVGTRSMQILTRLGYAVVEPDCPIIGPAERKNDGYIPQLRNNLFAVIDELDRRGFIDRTRLALGGHSYGAFGTANAMIHTPFFKAGIAGAGNYNRLLTPHGFQSEGRTLWESREVYLSMSPLLYVEQLTGALLMYHGMEDQNMGTWPINSERMYQALEGLGKPTALYMYPFEDHGQAARETILDMWARWVPWLDQWVKNPQAPKAVEPPARDDQDDPPLALAG
jgi:dipeptidyl aminopeptidase/acylaminoacyl peptidase